MAYARARPQHLGMAAGCTIAVGAIALILGIILVGAAMFASFGIQTARMYAGPWMPPTSWIMGIMLIVALVPIVFGAVALSAGTQLNSGRPSAWTSAVVVNVMSIIFALLSVFAAGFGLLHGILSGLALWALFQPDVKAYFGQ